MAINKQIRVNEKDAELNFNYHTFFPQKNDLLQNVSDKINFGWKHNENAFNDFNKQYLIPHMQSTRGPKTAVADVNKDGLDDIFVCGAEGQPGCLFIQTKEGKFNKSNTAAFAQNSKSEGVDAAFFDADNDGYPDLYVVSGGNEYEDGNQSLADHLYMNDGKGNFTEAITALPPMLTNKSCVSIADVNHDGSNDIFVGGLADAKKYGYAQTSYLLLNNGKGKFTLANQSVIALQQTGMVTTASFTDVNNDGWMDLIVAGEWMPVKIFINQKGVFKEKDIDASTGLWQTIYPVDINGDGYTDFLAGNWGHNSKLYAGKTGALKLYIKDFDDNGTAEQIMAYTINGKEYPFLGKDQLELALPKIKQQHLSYDEVAGQSVQYMLGDMFSDSKELKAETLGSCYFLNDGKGNFIKKELPDELQLSPVFAFSSFKINSNTYYISAGNFYGVQPYEGRYDAMNPTLFSFDKQTGRYIYTDQLPQINEETRDMRWINYKGGEKLLIVSNNNDSLVVLKVNVSTNTNK